MPPSAGSRIPTSFYWYLAALACIGGFLFGYGTSSIAVHRHQRAAADRPAGGRS
ncbi:MAG: hypothetical protein ACLQDY_27120 [Streptosporangiaceae bacterium]